jgi:hypothetical protein
MTAAPGEKARVRLRKILATSVAIVSMSTAAPAHPTTGIAYDSVTTLVSTSDPPLRRQDFGADFRAGQQPSSNCTPSLIRRYLTKRKERIEDVCKQEATIVDCNTRTATLLDLTNKRYWVVSLDAKYDDGIPDASARSADGMSSATAIERKALGPKIVGGTLTEEYTKSYEQSIVSSILSVTSVDRWRYYFAPAPLPELACIDVGAPWLSRYGTPQRYEPELQRYFAARIAKSRGSRDSLSMSGPELPSWRIVLYSVWERFQRQSGVADSTTFFKVESGNIRSIDDDDPAFTPPSGFAQTPQ